MNKNETKIVTVYEKNTYIRFQNLLRLRKALFKIHADFESMLKPANDNEKVGLNNEEYQDHNVCSYSYKLICLDE